MTNHQSDLLFCRDLSMKGFRPGAIKEGKELVSHPFPENDHIYIMARTTPGDPTSMEKFRISQGQLTRVDAFL